MRVAIITIEQKNILSGQEFAENCFFNPVQMGSDWIITEQEIIQTTNPEFIWVKDLELIEYQPQ